MTTSGVLNSCAAETRGKADGSTSSCPHRSCRLRRSGGTTSTISLPEQCDECNGEPIRQLHAGHSVLVLTCAFSIAPHTPPAIMCCGQTANGSCSTPQVTISIQRWI